MNEYLYAGTCILFGFRFKDNEVTESGAGLLYKPYQASDLVNVRRLSVTMKQRRGE